MWQTLFYDHGTVTWYSHQNADQWKTLILDTFEGVGLEKTSRRISVNIETAFNMRHRIMCMMEKELENEVLSGEVELDETFVESSRKSLAAEEDAGFGVVAERVKRGLSKQKVYIPAEWMDPGTHLLMPTTVASSARPQP